MLRDVAPLPPRDVLLVFDGAPDERVRRLFVSASGDASRLHLQQGRMSRGNHPMGPFYQLLQSELVDGTLRSIEQVARDRVLAFEFRNAAGGKRTLYAELVGRHGNLVLADERDRVLGLLVPAPTQTKSGRPPRLVVGEFWQRPPGQAPDHESLPAIEEEFDAPTDAPPGRGELLAPLSWRVERSLGVDVAASEQDAARRELAQRLRRRAKSARARVVGLETRERSAHEFERVRQDGDLLKANLARVQRGATSIELEDWFTEGAPLRRVELDPKLSPSQNVERLFARYRKLVEALENLPAELAEARQRAEEAEALLARAEDDATSPEALESEALSSGILDPKQVADPRKKKPPAPRQPYRVFVGLRGSEIRVGRSAKDNDTLSLKLSRGNDVWLHTADAPGSHVVLRLEGRTEPDDEELLDAATLAVHFSPLKDASRADVHVARCKQVKKPRGAKPGLVTLAGGKTLAVRMQPERLRRLLERGRRSAGEDD